MQPEDVEDNIQKKPKPATTQTRSRKKLNGMCGDFVNVKV